MKLDRTIEIRAARATVFRFFTESARWARWWGAGSTIEPVVGGAVRIVYPTARARAARCASSSRTSVWRSRSATRATASPSHRAARSS